MGNPIFRIGDEEAWYVRIKRGVLKKRHFKLPKLMRDLDDEDDKEDEAGMDGRVSHSISHKFPTKTNKIFEHFHKKTF